jgi:phage head maturation protease
MTREALLAEAARNRAAAVAARSDRPSQRRCAEVAGSLPLLRTRATIQLRAASDGSTLHFAGCASAYEQPYEMWDMFGPYTEIVSAGAGAQSLANPDLDVPLVLQHESLRRIARTTNGTLTLSEGDFETDDGTLQGLICEAPALDRTDVDVAYIEPKIRAGLIDEMSFRFSITSGQWSPDYMEYRINGYDIHRGDVAIVGYGANPATVAQLRAAGDAAGIKVDDLSLDGLRALERSVRGELSRRSLRPAMSLAQLDLID